MISTLYRGKNTRIIKVNPFHDDTTAVVSTATFFLLHCDEWDRVVALPRHKFVTGATLLQLPPQMKNISSLVPSCFPRPSHRGKD